MATDSVPTDGPPTTGVDANSYECFVQVQLDDELLVYERGTDAAWITSDTVVTLAERR